MQYTLKKSLGQHFLKDENISRKIVEALQQSLHDRLHRAYTHLYEAIPHLFCYLNDPQIPATSNRLESFFKHLKEKLLLHSGLRIEAKRNFIKWYLHFKNNRK